MAKAAFMFLQASVLVIALSVYPSAGHNKSETTDVCNISVDGDLSGSWIQAIHGAMSGQFDGDAGGYVATGRGASMSGSGSVSGSMSGGFSGSGSGSGSVSMVGNGLTNGKLIIDHLCDALGIPPVPPYKKQSANFSNGANFALAGSTVLPGSFFLRNQNDLLPLMWKSIPQSFDTQLQWFNNFMQNLKNGANKSNMDNSLFWLGNIGANDFVRIHKAAALSSEYITQQAIEHVAKLLQGLVNDGAKYIVVQGLPPLGCLPLELMLAPAT
ncbi:hypothetical protein CDL15_Pgr009808 [Punica granatum]|uniref:Uncharacterized protein n=1 Tax=Punica granatum TaxID=22663 RepID=A0A218WW03_PUNGR|nr:hypothetical protein CDL15_Pgr009808 [Punica granatum]